MKLAGATLAVIVLALIFTACAKESAFQKEINQIRLEKDSYMKDSKSSPFNAKTKVEFHPLNYFAVDSNFVFKSKLVEYPEKDTLTIYGTKGEPRQVVRYGYVTITYNGIKHNINVYEGSYSGGKYYSIWFTDRTTNEESYGVGRYLDFELKSDPGFVYTIDFNLAYNPYCAYSQDYSCAIPTKDDYIDIAITAGEKKFHD